MSSFFHYILDIAGLGLKQKLQDAFPGVNTAPVLGVRCRVVLAVGQMGWEGSKQRVLVLRVGVGHAVGVSNGWWCELDAGLS